MKQRLWYASMQIRCSERNFSFKSGSYQRRTRNWKNIKAVVRFGEGILHRCRQLWSTVSQRSRRQSQGFVTWRRFPHCKFDCDVVVWKLRGRTSAGFPRGIESIELWNRFSRPWKSVELGQNVHKIWKKYETSKLGHLFIQICSSPLITAAQWFCILCSMNKSLEKWSLMMVLKFFNLVLRKHGKVFENVWEPCVWAGF